jgi:hypothetical protein
LNEAAENVATRRVSRFAKAASCQQMLPNEYTNRKWREKGNNSEGKRVRPFAPDIS